MWWPIWIILAYFLILMAHNFYRQFKVKTQEDFMVAGRRLSKKVMVFTLICTWVGTRTFITNAEFAWKAGWSALWLPAGAWVGIILIYLLAARIRTFGQFTIGDILETRYGKIARIFGAVTIIIAFTTVVALQFRAGGFVLNVVTDGKISVELGQTITAAFVITFTALGGMIAVAYTDFPNGIIILLACCIAAPIVVIAAGGWDVAGQVLPDGHFHMFSRDFGAFPILKATGYGLSACLMVMGMQSMYQKFYSARTPREAWIAGAFWIVGTIVVEVIVIGIAIYGAANFWNADPPIDPASVILMAARHMMPRWSSWAGMLLIAAVCAVVISTGMNYLLSPSTNVMRDIYQRFINPDATPGRMVVFQKLVVVFLGVGAWLMVFVPTILGKSQISVLKYSYFAYTMYGVSITPAVIAALYWRRATRLAGVVSIFSGAIVTLFLEVGVPLFLPWLMIEGDPLGVPTVFPAFLVSFGSLVFISLSQPPPPDDEVEKLLPKRKKK